MIPKEPLSIEMFGKTLVPCNGILDMEEKCCICRIYSTWVSSVVSDSFLTIERLLPVSKTRCEMKAWPIASV